MQHKGDGIFVSVHPGLFGMQYFEESGMIASPPQLRMIQCDCWMCTTVYYKIQLPKNSADYKVKFTDETISAGEIVLLD